MEKSLTDVYKELAFEREQKCSGCGKRERMSHSHLVPKSRSEKLKTVKDNIVYHCLSMGNVVGCHTKWESMDCVTLSDFGKNMATVYELDREYFWIRMQKLDEYWAARNRTYWLLVRGLMAAADLIERQKVPESQMDDRMKFLRRNGIL